MFAVVAGWSCSALPCRRFEMEYNVLVIWVSYPSRVCAVCFAVSLPCLCRVFAVSLPCLCLLFAVSLPCALPCAFCLCRVFAVFLL